MKGYTSIDELMGSLPTAVRESPLPAPPIRRYREGWNEERRVQSLGAFSLDQIASGLNTDTKTLLLIGGGGILAGYLLNNALQSVRKTVRGVKSAIKGTKRKASKPLFTLHGEVTPIKLALIAAVIGGYWYYKHHEQSQMPPGPQA
jgi:hypothetical protein